MGEAKRTHQTYIDVGSAALDPTYRILFMKQELHKQLRCQARTWQRE
jgi:hypothetical protein